MTRPIIIIGTGLAGYNLAREFRKLDKNTPLHLITRDAGEFYSKPLLSSSLASNKQPDQLAMKTATQMASELGAEIHTQQAVTHIDPAQQTVQLADRKLDFEKLVLAVGADPIRPHLAGDAADAILTVNDLEDYRQCRAHLIGKKRVAILGAGLIGCEFANDWSQAGLEITLVDPAAWPLSRLLPEQAGRFMQRRLEDLGIQLRLGHAARAVSRSATGFVIELAQGDTLEADVVLSAIGLQPRTDLASQAGLAISRGIVVDRHLQTSHPAIYALGDCAEVAGLNLPFVMPIMQAARSLAPILAGQTAALAYPAMPVLVKTPACPTTVCPVMGAPTGEWAIQETATGLKALYQAGDQLLGFALLGDVQSEKQTLVAQIPAWLP
ncbi:rubredoxin-NAD+ reductase [Chitinivorax tropicus]|uniref:Rubredoxin-NAD+ reductase n=1 Tax=Chitinivorax tropicus TaxID=714531 RepID=A0A840MIJ3_9PROT|nr:FAD-dependent oxidoreductase [Chitinivorax tropicus]MBB5018468.1 rubredoxin-NAD+ reductase [Chitinivorax tropicus]